LNDENKGALNKYMAVIIAAKEARRLNTLQRMSGIENGKKVTTKALEKLEKGEIKWVMRDSEKAEK